MASAVAVGGLFLATSPAQAATTPGPIGIDPYVATICESGYTSYTTSNVATAQTITRAGIKVNGGQNPMTVSVTEDVQTTITASVTVSVSGTYSASAVIAQFQTSVGLTLAASGSMTATTSTTVGVTVPPMTTMVYAEGTVKVTGNWAASYCAGGTTLVNSSGAATTFRTAMTTAAVQCNLTQTDPFAIAVKSKLCT